MKSKVGIVSIIALLATVLYRSDASHVQGSSSHDQSCVVLPISNLRSACLQRVGVVQYDESNRSPDGLRHQLRRHFDVVLSLLDLATPNSIAIALSRLEAVDDRAWTQEERAACRQKLLTARGVQLQRLADYRDRGIFPLNEGQSTHALPIFVDRHGTACAVGHLMRCSGWTSDVDSIARSNNSVYVPDASRSAVAAWVLTSGLTLEEAALIQPGYYWAPNGQVDASVFEPGEAVFEREGLRYSNFRLQAQNSPTDTGAKPALAGLGLLAGKGRYYNATLTPYPIHDPIGTHWIAIGGSDARVQSPLHSLLASAAVGRGQIVVVNFDVAAIAADQRINGISESSYEYWQGFQGLDGSIPPASAIYYLKTTAFDAATSLAALNIDQSSPGGRKSDTKSFAAQQQVSVEARIWLENGVTLNTYVLDFNLVTVPEPTSALFGAALMVTCGLARRRGTHFLDRPIESRSTCRAVWLVVCSSRLRKSVATRTRLS